MGSARVIGGAVAAAAAILALLAAGPAGAARSPEDRLQPAVSFDGTRHLVVWQDFRNGAASDLYGARVGADGTVAERNGFPVARAARTQRAPAVAFGGTTHLVVWEDNRSGSGFDVYGARVAADGTVLDPAGIAIATGPGDQRGPEVAFSGGAFLVVWRDLGAGSAVRAARVGTDGTLLDAPSLTLPSGAGSRAPALAAGAGGFLLAWQDHRAGAAGDVYGARVTDGGTLLDPAGIAIATGADPARAPAVAFDGTSHLVVWTGPAGTVRGARLSGAGTVLDAPALTIAAGGAAPARPRVAFDGGSHVAVWSDARSTSGTDVYMARVSPDGDVLDTSPVTVTAARSDQRRPAVAAGAGTVLAAWEDGRTRRGPDVFAARVAGGSVLDPAGIPVPRRRDVTPPETRIAAGPSGRQASRTATFRFRSSEPGSTFRCRLDGRPWKPCTSPKTYRNLALGRHVFRVRARDRAGNVDPTPAKRQWRIAAPVPGLLRVVPGGSPRSGPGPLRRYVVEIEDGIAVDPKAVARTIDAILADPRGWGGTGRVSFQRVSSGPVSFRIALVTPRTVDRLCAPLRTGGIYSCAMRGRAVLNLMRWRRGAPAFGGNMTMYRRYLVNHEVGHLLGHGHRGCHRAGAKAPVMMQQTKGVGACRPNGWPLAWERR